MKEEPIFIDYIYYIKDGKVTITEYIGKSTDVIISKTVIDIKERAFERNQLTTVTIPSYVQSIGFRGFYWNKLTEINIEEGITEIGKYAFAQNLLEVITIPSSVETIGEFAFASGYPLDKINIKKPENTIQRI